MLLARLVIAVVANVGDDPNYYHAQGWDGPTQADLVVCATMAKDLNASFDALRHAGLNADWVEKSATCDITVTDDHTADAAPPAAAPVSYQL